MNIHDLLRPRYALVTLVALAIGAPVGSFAITHASAICACVAFVRAEISSSTASPAHPIAVPTVPMPVHTA